MPHRVADGKARGDEVAEALARAFVAGHIDGRREEHEVPGEFAPERLDLVLALAPGQIGEADVDLLQAQHVGVGDAPRLVRDACRVDDAVDAAAPLDVPGDEPHYLRFLRFRATICSCSVNARNSGCRCSQSKAAITLLAISAADLVSTPASSAATSFQPCFSAVARAWIRRCSIAARSRLVGQRRVSSLSIRLSTEG